MKTLALIILVGLSVEACESSTNSAPLAMDTLRATGIAQYGNNLFMRDTTVQVTGVWIRAVDSSKAFLFLTREDNGIRDTAAVVRRNGHWLNGLVNPSSNSSQSGSVRVSETRDSIIVQIKTSSNSNYYLRKN